MSYPPPSAPNRPSRVTPPLPSQPSSELPPLIERSPKLPVPGGNNKSLSTASSFIFPTKSTGNEQGLDTAQPSSAQRYLQSREQKKLFDSADYFSTSPSKRASGNNPTLNGSAFEQVEYEANRLTQEPRASALNFEMITEVEGGNDVSSDEEYSDSQQHPPINPRKPPHNQQHSMRRGSLEEFFVEENQHETVKHAILEKPKLKRWDSGEFYSSPNEYRKMLATQAKEVLRKALDNAEEDHRPRRRRRSSLSMSETHSNEEDQRMSGD